jgi:hypothetical protein
VSDCLCPVVDGCGFAPAACWMRVAQLSEPSLAKRYSPSVSCEMRPVFGSLNDWTKVQLAKVEASASDERAQDCDDDDDGDDLEDGEGEEGEELGEGEEEFEDGEWAVAEYTDRLGDDVEAGDILAIAAPGDRDANGVYLLRAEGAAYELREERWSGDEAFGMLEAGTRVVEAYWLNLVGKPGRAPHYYTPSDPKECVRLPTHLLLLAGFDAPAATRRKGAGSSNANAAAAKGGVEIAADVHDDLLQEIGVRAALDAE